MLERPRGGDRAVLVNLDFGNVDFAESLEEIRRLAESADVKPVTVVKGRRQRPDAATFAGSGKVEEIAALVQSTGASLVLFNHDLSPAQQRNLEKRCNCRVIDRTILILDIFAQRARSHEGKLQVELAQLEHLATRLVRGWTHLERQKGGIGLRGPGETTLDTTSRRVSGANGAAVVMSDTVGFIRDLPHALVAAFSATLEETVRTDLLLHVVDAASPARDDQIAEVNKIRR